MAKKTRRGGRRPGAGAKPGNLNALKHGRYSQQFALIGALLARDPEMRKVLNDIADRTRMKEKRASTIASALMANLLRRARNTARRTDSSNPIARIDESGSIKAAIAAVPYESLAGAAKNLKNTPEPSDPPHETQDPSKTRYENPLMEPGVNE